MISSDCFYRGGGPESEVPLLQAWTRSDLDKALENDRCLDGLHDLVQPGNFLEIFEVGDLRRPEADPLAMALVIVGKVEGPHVRFHRIRETVRFLGDIEEVEPGWGIGTWNKKRCLYFNGRRVKVFHLPHEEPEFRNNQSVRRYLQRKLSNEQRH